MHRFDNSLAVSHEAEDLPFWEETYQKAFPEMIGMHNHRQDGDHQRSGIDRSIIMSNGKRLWIDEKVRSRNKKTGKVYEDIALEYISNDKTNTPGWVCKELLCDYIAYAIAPLGRCLLLPVPQLQQAWERNKEKWLSNPKYRNIKAANENEYGQYIYSTLSCCVPEKVLFREMGRCLRVNFKPFELEE